MGIEVTIKLTLQQAEKLSTTLWECGDEGPRDVGWASDELVELRELVDSAIESARS